MASLIRITGAVGLALTCLALFITLEFDVGDAVGPFWAMGILLILGAMVGAAVREFTELQQSHQRDRPPPDPDTCQECGYDLARLPANRCPECGTLRPERSGGVVRIS